MIRFSSKKQPCKSCIEGKKDCLHYFFGQQRVHKIEEKIKQVAIKDETNTSSTTNK